MTHTAARLILVLGLVSVARADDAGPRGSHLFTASEFPSLAVRGFELQTDGDYTVKVWTPPREVWTLTQDGSSLTLTSKVEGSDSKPRWRTVGTAALKAGTPVKVVVAPPKPADDKPRPVTPVPALLSISSDPSSDPALDLVRGDLSSTAPTADSRRSHVRTNKEGLDFRAPASAQAWRDRARAVREQLLVTLGLWPMFPKTALHPKVVGKLDRDGYTIEKVVIETLPGFFLAGNLYRPTERPGKLPLMLCPHGHWPEGRVNTDVQLRCVQWAKLGCVVFSYDMVGYADSKPFGHTFLNPRLRLWGLSLPTLQTWNSVRALDWLTSLPGVDPARVGCTGESGGGRRRSCSPGSTTGSRSPPQW